MIAEIIVNNRRNSRNSRQKRRTFKFCRETISTDFLLQILPRNDLGRFSENILVIVVMIEKMEKQKLRGRAS